MAVTALLRLAKLTGRTDLHDKAEATLRLYAGLLKEHPTAAGQMLIALDFDLGPVRGIRRGRRPGGGGRRGGCCGRSGGGFEPNAVVALRPAAGRCARTCCRCWRTRRRRGRRRLYVCRDFACQAPLVGAEAVEAALGAKE